MKEKVVHRCARITAFVLIGFLLLTVVQDVLVQEGADVNGATERMLAGIKELDENTVDVLFLGSSVVYNGVSPLKLYEDAGVLSYSMGSSGQPIEISYFLLKDAYARQSPKVVFLEASCLFGDDNADGDLYWRDVMDQLPWGETKLQMAKVYEEKHYDGGWLSALFPIIKYHSRWDELSSIDFIPMDKDSLWSMGERTVSYSASTSSTREYIDHWSEELAELNTVHTERIENGEHTEEDIVSDNTYAPMISDYNLEYLKKMYTLCRENGTDLVLFKEPNNTVAQYNQSTWTKQKNVLVHEAVDKLGIPLLDMNYDRDIGLNIKTDYFDGGSHLNIRGSHKVTACLEQYILDNYDLDGRSDPYYDDALVKYKKVSNVAYLESETVFGNYLRRLLEDKQEMTICLAAYGDYTVGLTDEDHVLLEDLGLELVRDGQFMDAYAAVICGGETVYEELSNGKINHTVKLDDASVTITSAGWLVGVEAKITWNGAQVGMQSHGLNIVVVDNEMGLVIDSVCFNTYQNSQPATRNKGNTYNRLTKYTNVISKL